MKVLDLHKMLMATSLAVRLKFLHLMIQFTQFSGFNGALQSNTATIRVPDKEFYFVHADIERKITECPVAN
jgi:hypothetical protein